MRPNYGSEYDENVRLSNLSYPLHHIDIVRHPQMILISNTLPTVPELRVYTLWDKPIGPHPIGMFEVNLFTPAQFGAFISWLVINRGPLSALVHPNTGDDIRDHTQRATWLGQPFPLQVGLLRKMVMMNEEKEKEKEAKA